MKGPVRAAVNGRLSSKESVQSCDGPIDDNFAFIEQLLDTLEAEGKTKEPDAGNEKVQAEVSDAEADRVQPLPELQLLGQEVSTSGEPENWSALLNRFCEDGDESVVEVLLDRFMKSSGDVGHLIEEIDKGLPKKPVRAEASEQAGDLSLDFSHLRSPALETWEALLHSARGILHSARSHSMASARSGRSAAFEGGPVAQPTPAPATGNAQEADAVDNSKSSENETIANSGADLSAKAEVLARLSSQDDPEAMRKFMKTFLLGVRERYMSSIVQDAVRVAAMGDSGSERGDDSDSSGGSTSEMSCRSVSNVETEQSDV
mmetsp:Transcript_26989/g.48790  ORF Transcript_26989/g.48790 Transcript_26989/m.48790 type:complete len:318 (+) Transcript_26989:61-1014(+)